MANDAYIDAAYVTEYFGDYDITDPQDSDISDALLLKASEYIDGRYGDRFAGVKSGGREQARAWPRDNARDVDGNAIDGVPAEVKRATMLVALRAYTDDSFLKTSYVPGKQVASATVFGAVAVSYAQTDGAGKGDAMLDVFSEVEFSLLPILSRKVLSGIRLIK